MASFLWVSASVISPEDALQRVMDSGVKVPTRALQAKSELSYTFNSKIGEATVYVFSNNRHEGYLIVSADDKTTPLLGYADEGSFDPDNIPPAMQGWLESYSRQIQFARTMPAVGMGTRAGVELPAWEPVEPLLKTTWNQTAPFNKLCPKDAKGTSVTGCVATAMAQVMAYFKYPETGQGSSSYEWSYINGKDTVTQTLSMDYSKITFDWDNMLDNYGKSYTSAQADAVATLMQACGYGVEMNYTSNESGAYSGFVARALIYYF